MTGTPLYVGIDVGTSGVRAMAIDGDRRVVAQGAARMITFGDDHRDPLVWKAATRHALAEMLQKADPFAVRAVSVDGTSGTMVAIDSAGAPVANPIMYNDPVVDNSVVERIANAAPQTSPALGSNSALARAIVLKQTSEAVRVIHQSDWISGLLSGRFDISDANNALKTGYDAVSGCWPDWIEKTGMETVRLPAIVEPGTATGTAGGKLAREVGLAADAVTVAGTTDGCASFLATGAKQPGDGVTALGTTLTVKLFCDAPLFAPEYGIYSHRLAGGWLAGGASNTGGNVLAHFFEPDRIAELSSDINPAKDSGLGYYPLVKPGERFPVNDTTLEPRLAPRPESDLNFLKGILEGIANVEALAYLRLAKFGAPKLISIRTVGGGAKNVVWSAIRQRKLGVPSKDVMSTEAAFGTALLAMQAVQ